MMLSSPAGPISSARGWPCSPAIRRNSRTAVGLPRFLRAYVREPRSRLPRLGRMGRRGGRISDPGKGGILYRLGSRARGPGSWACQCASFMSSSLSAGYRFAALRGVMRLGRPIRGAEGHRPRADRRHGPATSVDRAGKRSADEIQRRRPGSRPGHGRNSWQSSR